MFLANGLILKYLIKTSYFNDVIADMTPVLFDRLVAKSSVVIKNRVDSVAGMKGLILLNHSVRVYYTACSHARTYI